MHSSNLQYLPLSPPFFLILIVLLAVAIAWVQIRAMEYAYARMGIPLKYFFFLLISSLLGSYINIPVANLPNEQIVSGQIVNYYGMQYVIPEVVNWPGTVIAVNIGGAVIPLLVSLYLVTKFRIYLPAFLAVIVVALACHQLAHPVRGLGIAEPAFVPALVTAFTAIVISRKYAAPIAYIAGSMGTLIGADLLNLDRVRGLGAPVASIGGAGTFDGIFITGIIAVLLAGLFTPRRTSISPKAGAGTK
jgi:uncharacterized membrane protein